MEQIWDELYHHGIKGMKWGVHKSRSAIYEDGGKPSFRKTKKAASKLTPNKTDSQVTKRVKNDYNKMSDADFRRKYSTSKKKYAKRVAKSSTGDPYADRRDKMTKTSGGQKRFDKAVKKEARQMTSVHLGEKAEKINANRSTGSKAITRILSGKEGNKTYGLLRASGSTKKGAALTMALFGRSNQKSAGNYADKKYQKSSEGTKYRKRIESSYYN